MKTITLLVMGWMFFQGCVSAAPYHPQDQMQVEGDWTGITVVLNEGTKRKVVLGKIKYKGVEVVGDVGHVLDTPLGKFVWRGPYDKGSLRGWVTAASDLDVGEWIPAEMKVQSVDGVYRTVPLVAVALMPAAKSYEEINANVTPENVAFFEKHLSECPKDEIRCVWFLNNHVKVGMLMTINLQSYQVNTVRKVYNWASQGARSRELSGSQVASLKGLMMQLPAKAEGVVFGKGMHVAFWKDGKAQVVTYDRMACPTILQRIYDIGGGSLECKYAE